MKKRDYWAWLASNEYFYFDKIQKILKVYGTAENLYNIAWLLYILRKEVLKLVDRKIIYFEDKEYPLELKRLKQPPQQLYVIGNTELLKGENTKIAIVGTRKNTEYQKRT